MSQSESCGRRVIAFAYRHGIGSVNQPFQIVTKNCGGEATSNFRHTSAMLKTAKGHARQLASNHSKRIWLR
jgi:hypothetical protein